MLSSHLFLRLPCLFPLSLFFVKWFWPHPMNGRHDIPQRLFIMVRRCSCGPISCWILARTSSLVTWSLYEMRSILRKYLISMACILLWSSAVGVRDSQAYMKRGVTRERMNVPCNWEKYSYYPNSFQPCQCCWCLCNPGEYLRLGIFFSYNWAQVLEVCDCLKLLSTASFKQGTTLEMPRNCPNHDRV